MSEVDPNGKSANDPGAKLDAGKVRPALVIQGFRRALLAISEVGTFGAAKYTDNGWKSVPDGRKRYEDALYRHLLAEGVDEQSGLPHLAHAAWNLLAMLELETSEKDVIVATKERPISVDFLLGKSNEPYKRQADTRYNFPPSFMDTMRKRWENLGSRFKLMPYVYNEDMFIASKFAFDGLYVTEFCPKDRILALRAAAVESGEEAMLEVPGVSWVPEP